MAKAKKTTEAAKEPIRVPPIQRKRVTLTIRSLSPMIQHAWTEKSKAAMREKHAGKKTKNRSVRDPEAECDAAAYRTSDGQFGVPLMAIKKSIITAAHKDIGIERTLVRKALFLPFVDPSGNVPIRCEEPELDESTVRVGAGSTDLRYRPRFDSWEADVTFEIDAGLLTVVDLLTLVDRAGFGVGIGEWRPEKDGDYGRFCVDKDAGVKEEVI